MTFSSAALTSARILAAGALVAACCARSQSPAAAPATPSTPPAPAPIAPPPPPASLVPREPAPPPPPPSLAARLGGLEGLGRLVHATLARVDQDRRVSRMLRGPNRPDVESRMTALLCAAAGGTDCPAGAPTLETAHWGERVTDREFDAFLEDLTAAMGELGIGEVEQNELLAVVGPLRARVVPPAGAGGAPGR